MKKNEISKTPALRILVCTFIFTIFSGSLFAQPYPPYTVNVFDTAATTGYYFFSPKLVLSISGVSKETQMILDRYGNLIYYHDFPFGGRSSDFKIQPNGQMTYSTQEKFYIMDSTFNIVDSVECKNGLIHDGHEFQILPNGHFLYLANEKPTMDLSSYHIFKGNNTPGSKTARVLCGVIQEQDANKNVVFEWHTKHFFAFDDTDPTYLYDTNDVDWTHCNSLELDVDGNILLSTRQFNEITKINRSDSSIMWRLGGLKNQFTFINDSSKFRMQHDARRIANGNITVYDNGFKIPLHPEAAKEYQIDENLMTANLVWSYTYDSTNYSKSRGNMQRLSNGNTIVGYGRMDGNDILFNNVNAAGVPVFEVKSYDSLVSYRVFNYPVLPWSLNRPVITCDQNGGHTFLSVESGLTSYIWSTGDTVFKIEILHPDTYYVFIPRGNGGFIKSEELIVEDLIDPCHAMQEVITDGSFSIFPNPVGNTINLQTVILKGQVVTIEIFDALGKKVYSCNVTLSDNLLIPVNPFEQGLYFIRINGERKKFIKL